MHLVPGLVSSMGDKVKIVQATRSSCAPILSVASYADSLSASRSCVEFNDDVFGYLKRMPTIKTVILSSPFYTLTSSRSRVAVRSGENGGIKLTTGSVDLAFSNMMATLKKIEGLGVKAVVVTPPPMGGFDMGLCVERVTSGLPVFGIAEDCGFSLRSADIYAQGVRSFFDHLIAEGVAVVDLLATICHEGFCRPSASGVMLYRDAGHLSIEGSVHLFKRGDLVEQF